MTIHIFVDLFVSILILSLVFIIYIKQKTYKKNSNNLIKILNNNVQFLTDLYKKHEVIELKKAIDLYSQFQIILKMSKCDYISFFKYNYSKKYIILHFVLSIDNKGSIIQTSILDNLPVTANLSILNILKSDDNDLYLLEPNYFEGKNDAMFKNLKDKNINTIYYQNVFKNKETPLGFISMSYKDKGYILPEDDKVEILRIIEKMKSLI